MSEVSNNLSDIFKAEYSNLVSVLCRVFGVRDIQLVQDVVSESFIQAMKSWSQKGVPDQPKAWLRKVATNKLKDHFRRHQNFNEKISPVIQREQQWYEEASYAEQLIEDSQLNMIFALCHYDLKSDAQICLSLRLLCGFTPDEIAAALLTNKENINKKLYRAKQRLRDHKEDWNTLNRTDYIDRVDNAIRVIYLLFNEGYYSSISDIEIRHELCWEAMRLGVLLSKQEFLPRKKIYALMGLMCFHASRFDARTSVEGQFILHPDQDRSKWNKPLIIKGEKYLSLASQGSVVSKYHIEAAIAYWHTQDTTNKWEHILQLYNKLLIIQYTPVVAMNRTYALAKANSVEEAINEAQKLNLEGNHLYYSLLAELYRESGDSKMEVKYLNSAIQHARKENERALLQQKLAKASQSE